MDNTFQNILKPNTGGNMSVKVIISDILKKRHDRVTALEVLRRDLGGLETALENLLGIAGGADSR